MLVDARTSQNEKYDEWKLLCEFKWSKDWVSGLTCWTCTLPPFRMEMPSLRVQVTMGPRRPGDERRRQVWLLRIRGSWKVWGSDPQRNCVCCCLADRSPPSCLLPLVALIICNTISAAPRACSLACWYRIFCFSISFSWGANAHIYMQRRSW